MRTVIFVIYLAVLIAVAWIDWKTQTIPDIAVIFIGILGMIAIPFFPEITLIDRVAGVFSISLPLLLIAVIVPGAFGGGDIKLMFVVGLVLHPILGLLIIFLSSFIALPVALILYWTHREKVIPFGPFILIALNLVYLMKIDVSMLERILEIL